MSLTVKPATQEKADEGPYEEYDGNCCKDAQLLDLQKKSVLIPGHKTLQLPPILTRRPGFVNERF